MNPSFTIAIPVFERLFGFEEALQSARAVQGCTEILVGDNQSSHNEFEKICAAQNDPRIRYVMHETNYGIYGNQNRCAQLATGDFISFLGGDDIIAPDIYERFLKAYNEMPDVDVFFGPYTVFYSTIDQPTIERPYPNGPVSSRQFLEDAADYSMRFHVLSVMRREKVLAYPFITDPHSGNDLLWIYSNASHLKLYADEKPISYWRRYPEQDSAMQQLKMFEAWPVAYCSIAEQLKQMKSKKEKRAYHRAESLLLSLILNERTRDGYWRDRLTGPSVSTNAFVAKAKEIADRNWILSGLIHAKKTWPVYYQIARTCRRFKLYQGIFD